MEPENWLLASWEEMSAPPFGRYNPANPIKMNTRVTNCKQTVSRYRSEPGLGVLKRGNKRGRAKATGTQQEQGDDRGVEQRSALSAEGVEPKQATETEPKTNTIKKHK